MNNVAMDAILSDCGTYRYALERRWDLSKAYLVVVMVNPSTADATVNDPTILRLIAFAKRWGYGGLLVVNLFSFRSPDPATMKAHADPYGPEHSTYLNATLMLAKDSDLPILVAWGNNGTHLGADQDFRFRAQALGVPLICLGTTKDGHPKHPLARGHHRIPDDFIPVPFA